MESGNEKLIKEYEFVWKQLKNNLEHFSQSLRNSIKELQQNTDNPLHSLLTEIYYYPKSTVIEYLEGSIPRGTPEPGAISGLFFEDLIASIFNAVLPEEKAVHRNMLPTDPDLDALKEDKRVGISKPDIYYKSGDTHHLLEIKFAGTTGFFRTFKAQSDLIQDQDYGKHIRHWAIIGWSSINHTELGQVGELEKTLCILDGSESAKPSLDSFVKFDGIVGQILDL